MREIDDRALEALLIRTLVEHAEEIPFSLTADALRTRLEDRRRRGRWVTPGRRIVLFGLAAMLLVPIGAFVAGSLWTDQGPRISAPSPAVNEPDPTSNELPSPDVTVAPVADTYQALVVRYTPDATIFVAVRGDRQERVIASIPTLGRGIGYVLPSASGWVAIFYFRAETEFIDLRDPAQAPRPFSIPEGTTSFSWHPDGRFAALADSGVVTLIDPETGEVTPFTLRGPLGDVIGWAADGSALVAYGSGGDGIYAGGELVTDAPWRVIRLDGGPDEAVAPDLYPGLIAFSNYGRAGARLQQCQGDDCPGLPTDAVVGEVPGGSPVAWYSDELAPDAVDGSSFAGDGTAVWLVLDRRAGGRQFVLARLDAPGTPHVAATSGLPVADHEVLYDALSIEGVAPDDSLVAVGAARAVVLVEPITGRSTAIDGQFLGFVPSATADTWPGEPFRPFEPPALEAVLPAYPPLPPLGDLVDNQLITGDRELWRQEYVALEGSAGTPSTTEIGPLDIATGLGVVLACSGPSDVLVTMTPDSPMSPLETRCDDGDTAGGQVPWWSGNVSATFVVTAATDTSWQLVIFDPAPE
jgi:hypothetical protein